MQEHLCELDVDGDPEFRDELVGPGRLLQELNCAAEVPGGERRATGLQQESCGRDLIAAVYEERPMVIARPGLRVARAEARSASAVTRG